MQRFTDPFALVMTPVMDLFFAFTIPELDPFIVLRIPKLDLFCRFMDLFCCCFKFLNVNSLSFLTNSNTPTSSSGRLPVSLTTPTRMSPYT